MMKLFSTTLSLCLYLVAMLVSPGSLAAQEQTPEIVLSVDYIEPEGEILRTSFKYDFIGNPLTTVS